MSLKHSSVTAAFAFCNIQFLLIHSAWFYILVYHFSLKLTENWFQSLLECYFQLCSKKTPSVFSIIFLAESSFTVHTVLSENIF